MLALVVNRPTAEASVKGCFVLCLNSLVLTNELMNYVIFEFMLIIYKKVDKQAELKQNTQLDGQIFRQITQRH